MNVGIGEVVKEAGEFIALTAGEKKYGDITVTVTMNDGVPVKLTTGFCEHIARRTTTKFVVEK